MSVTEIGILSTTHIDLHNERMSKGALEFMVQKINGDDALAITVEHDPTLPPLGKITEGWLEQAEDGEYRACGLFEYFDKPQTVVLEDGTSLFAQESSSDRRPFTEAKEKASDTFVIAYDRQNFRSSEDVEKFLGKIRKIENFDTHCHARKSLISDPQITITVTALLAGFIAGRLMTEALASQGRDQLEKLRQIVFASLSNISRMAIPKNRNIFHVLNIPGEPNIELIAKTRRLDLLETAITEEALSAVKSRADYFARTLNAQKIQFLLNSTGSWIFNYLYTATGMVIGTPVAYDNRAKALQIFHEQGKRSPPMKSPATRKQPGRLAERASMNMPSNGPIDFLIIAPLQEECEAILTALSPFSRPDKAPKIDHDQHIYYPIKVPFLQDGTDEIYRVVVVPLRKMGQKEAASTSTSAIRRWRPAYVVVVGIAGGSPQAGVKLGDVIIADMVVDYEMQKITESGPEIRYEGETTDRDMLGAAKAIDNLWHQTLQSKRPDQDIPHVHFGPVLSGDKVVAAEDGVKGYRSTWPKMIGLEMEAAGVMSACRELPAKRRPGFFMIRGVSDLADANKNREEVKPWRPYAVSVAAEFLLHLLKSAPVIPVMRSFTAPRQNSGEE